MSKGANRGKERFICKDISLFVQVPNFLALLKMDYLSRLWQANGLLLGW